MVATQNLTVYQGADFQQILELRDENSALMDLTDYVFRGQAKSSYADASPVFSMVFSVRDQVTNTGLVDMSITASSTSTLSIVKKTNYLYDIEMVDADGIVRRIVQGQIELYPEVTK